MLLLCLSLSLSILICIIGIVNSQYPDLIYDSTATLGQCLSDADCAIYIQANSTLGLLGLFCDATTSRCSLPNGQTIGPAFASGYMGYCTYDLGNFGSVYTFPSFAPYSDLNTANSYLADGMIIANLALTSVTFEGVLRLYLNDGTVAADILANNVQVPYYDEQFVNSPTTTYIFRNLFANPPIYPGYLLVYYDISGCIIIYSGAVYMPCIRSDCNYPFYFGPSTPIPAPLTVESDLVLPNIAATYNAATRKASYVANPATWVFPTGQTAVRCLTGQLFDSGGRVMSAKINNDMISGLFFPQSPSGAITPATSANRLSGFVQLVTGIGYCITDAALVNPQVLNIIQDVNGVFEINRGQNAYLDLSSTAPSPPYVVGGIITGANVTVYFNTSRQYTRLNLVQFNSYFVANSPPAPPDPFGPTFGDYVDLSSNPVIEVLSTPTQVSNIYSVCNMGTQASPLGIVAYDYSAFNLLSGIADLQLVLINTTDPNFTEIQRGLRLAFLLPGTFPIYEYGFYCLNLIMNFLDALGKRTVLQSCFQVTRLSATVTQLDSFFNNEPQAPFPQYGFPYAGYGSYVTTSLYVNLPPFLILPNPLQTLYRPRIQIYRFSPDTFDEAQLQNYDGTTVDVYDNYMGALDVADLYTIILYNTNVTVYYRPASNFNHYIYPTISYNGAAWVSTEVVLVSFQIFVPVQFLSYYTSYMAEKIDYNCTNTAVLSLLSNTQVSVGLTYVEPICPSDLGATYMHVNGGLCAPVISYQLSAMYNNPAPFKNPCTYFMSYYNVQDPNNAILLYGTQNGVLYAAPPNVPLMAVGIDVMGNIGRHFFQLTSDEPANSTYINFLPPIPLCNGNNVTYVNESLVTQQTAIYTFVIGGIVNVIVNKNGTNATISGIYGWQPLDVLALAAYDPNSPFFDLPQDCLLLQNMTAYDVFLMCYNQSSLLLPLCTNCTHLPIPYENTNGTQLMATSEGWWEAYIWRPTTQVNPKTGRQWYCRFANSTLIQIPQAPFFVPTSLRRLYINGSQCAGAACFAIDLTVVIDPFYAPTYGSIFQLISNPPFNSLAFATAVSPPALNANSKGVSMATDYVITIYTDNFFCPVTQVYTPSTTGPVIEVVRTTHSVCNTPSGTAMFYMSYYNPTLQLGSGYTARVCMFWLDYVTPFFSFNMPINAANPTAIPFSPDFFVSENITRFYDVSAGLNTIVVYDACVGAINCPANVDCAALINQNTLQVSPSTLNFQIFQFTVDQFSAPGGGIVISQDNITLAKCYGDQYDLKYSVFDDQGEPNAVYGPYDWQLFAPFTNDLISQTPTMCHYFTDPLTGKVTITGGAQLNNPLPIVNFKVYLFDIVTFIPTGNLYGLRASGNYTLIVHNCATGCVQTSIIFIDMVNPLDVNYNTISTNCAYGLGSNILDVSSGTPFQPGQLFDQYYEPLASDPTFVVSSLYETFWLTPANPTTYVRTRLPIQNAPGNYSVKVCDANSCCAVRNATISSPPPMSISVYNIAGSCQSNTATTIQFVINGGTGPPYYTLQNLTLVQAGQNISFEFVSAFNQTLCFTVMDSVGCIYPSQVCLTIPEPGPVPVNVTTVDSCPYQATGSATATSLLGSGYTCQWKSPTVNFPASQTCTIPNVPAGTQLQVIVKNIIGCIGNAFVTVGSRPPLFVSQQFRSVIGGLGTLPCINYANLTVFGGVYGPNYTVTLVQDATGAVLTYNKNYSITITNMCRGIQYVIAVRDGDGQCLQTFFSNDPDFDFGSGNQSGIVIPTALPPFQFNEQGSFGSTKPQPTPTPPPQPLFFQDNKAVLIVVIIIALLLLTVALVYIFTSGYKRSSSSSVSFEPRRDILIPFSNQQDIRYHYALFDDNEDNKKFF